MNDMKAFASREAYIASDAHQSVCRIIPCGACSCVGTLGQIKMHREEAHSNKLLGEMKRFEALRLKSTSFRADPQAPAVISGWDFTEFNKKHDASFSLFHTLCQMAEADIAGGYLSCLLCVSCEIAILTNCVSCWCVCHLQ